MSTISVLVHLFHKKMKSVLSVPIPASISYQWNYGSLLGFIFLIQLFSGFFLALQYEGSSMLSFKSVISYMQSVEGGWAIRFVHANGASFFFVLIYLHIGRGIYYGSYKNLLVWVTGVMMIFILMGTAFLGYVLPWGQMSFWGATVITNLLSAFPYIGESLVYWLWGGFSVGSPTLTRMFSIHFLMPFILLVVALSHIAFLHEKGSSNPLGLSPHSHKVAFHPYFVVKDVVGLVVVGLLFGAMILLSPDLLMDPDNSIEANPMVTPPHIQPEWYFLFAYTILRSVPSKLGGVMAMIMSILILLILPFSDASSGRFSLIRSVSTWIQINNFFLLTWLGSMPVEAPFEMTSKYVTCFYFLTFLFWGFWKF
uniref:Cytochrome b n=1 Tax=Polyplax spinulosa TaxID=468197 RepID=V9PXI5_9NEOP|nr:cytochrome b [Polyplax spinulosa]